MRRYLIAGKSNEGKMVAIGSRVGLVLDSGVSHCQAMRCFLQFSVTRTPMFTFRGEIMIIEGGERVSGHTGTKERRGYNCIQLAEMLTHSALFTGGVIPE